MPIYIAVPLTSNSAAFDAAVEAHIAPSDRYKLQAEAGWLISFAGTTVELSNQITLTGQQPGMLSPLGSALITPITSYYGRGPNDMWEWLKTRFEG